MTGRATLTRADGATVPLVLAPSRGAPPGTEVGMTYDDADSPIDPGDVIESDATGRRWLVVSARVQLGGKHAGRHHLRCVVLAPDAEIDPGAVVHPLVWGPRS